MDENIRERDTADTTLEWYLLCESNISSDQSKDVNLELEMRAPVITVPIIKHSDNNNTAITKTESIDVGCTRFEIVKYEEYDLHYFKQIGSSDIFRSKTRSPFIYERKTRIHRTHLFNDTVTLELSMEKDIDARSIMYPLTFINKVHITKTILKPPSYLMSTLNSNIKCELVYRDGFSPTLEIEFTPSSYAEVINLYINHIQTLPMWPPLSSNKPMQVSIIDLARKISSGLYTISPKADGEHVHMYLRLSLNENNAHIKECTSFIIISDSGSILYTHGIYTKVSEYNPNYIYSNTELKSTTSLFVLECEFIELKHKLYIFDILKRYGPSPILTPINLKIDVNNKYNNTTNNYINRIKYINELVSTLNIECLYAKPVIHINSTDALEELDTNDLQLEVSENDGFIITNIYTSKEKFKMKTINTADLMYLNNAFYTASSELKLPIDVSKIRNNSDISLENNKIYEIDIDNHKIIRIRTDKHTPNAIVPTYCPPDSISILKNSNSVPFARMINNKYKHNLLKVLFVYLSNKKYNYSLVDIGSGKLGDMNKWINLKSNTSYIKLLHENNDYNGSGNGILLKREYGCGNIYAVDPEISKTRWYDAIKNSYINNTSFRKPPNNKYDGITRKNGTNTNTIHNKAPKLANLHSINCIRKSSDEFMNTYQYKLLFKNEHNLNHSNVYCLSIFFVPWSDSFVPLIYNAECTAIIIMDKPQTIETPSYSVKVNASSDEKTQEVLINIPGSETAVSIKETRVTIEHIMSQLHAYATETKTENYAKFSYKVIDRKVPTVIPSIEQKLVEMYTGYIIYKNYDNQT